MSPTTPPNSYSPATEQPPQSPTSTRYPSPSPAVCALESAIQEDDLEAAHHALQDGANPNSGRFSPVFEQATSKELITLLYHNGARVERLKTSAPARLILVGLSDIYQTGNDEAEMVPARPLDRITDAQFEEDRARRFGTANPEKMDIPFWRAMVEAPCWAYAAREKFLTKSREDSDETHIDISGPPIWCFDRMGCSLTELPDGTIVQIAGEHEDGYDPDFIIYNDVIVHHADSGHGNPKFDIYGYPEGVFRPTDFHTATYVPDQRAIYIIGNNGYGTEDEKAMYASGETPVYRLDIGTWKISAVTTHGNGPGSIHEHAAKLVGDDIVISHIEKGNTAPNSMSFRTKRYTLKDGERVGVEIGVNEEWTLALKDMTWQHTPGN